MKEILEQFAEEYSLISKTKLTEVDSKRDAYSPIIFVFVGDKVRDAVKVVKKAVDENWSNSSGVRYLYLSGGESLEEAGLHQVNFKVENREKKNLRENVYKEFLKNESNLIELNEAINKMKNEILESGVLFNYFQRLSISVITRADDPLNALVIPLTLMIKDKFQNTFSLINSDLFDILEERSGSEDDSYYRAVAMSFFKEIELCQSPDFKFEEEINVQKSGIKFKVSNNSFSVFDIIYMLSDRNRRGVLLQNSLKNNAQVAAYVSILKNGNSSDDIGVYNEGDFRGNSGFSPSQVVYASAGLSMVRRPNDAIAHTVILTCYEALIKLSKSSVDKADKNLLSIFKLDDASLDANAEKLTVTSSQIEMMTGIMPRDGRGSLSSFKNMRLSGFEKDLYGEAAVRFFDKNFKQKSFGLLQRLNFKEKLKKEIYANIIDKPQFGIFPVSEWTNENRLPAAIRESLKSIEEKLQSKENTLHAAYNKKTKIPFYYIFPWFKAKVLYLAEQHLFKEIYSIKLDILKLQIKKALLEIGRESIVEIHNELNDSVELSEQILKEIKHCCDKEIEAADEYVGGNIKTYYSIEVNKLVDKLSEAEKTEFAALLKHMQVGKEVFLKKFLDYCKKHILTKDKLYEPFEQEMHNRANSSIVAGDDSVMAWNDLYNKIYNTLEENCDANINIMDYAIKRLHEEKYFFGNYESNFIQYAFEYDSTSRNYKLGCVNEKNSKGIEKLRIIGGFMLNNVTFISDCKVDYEYFKGQGYGLHGINVD